MGNLTTYEASKREKSTVRVDMTRGNEGEIKIKPKKQLQSTVHSMKMLNTVHVAAVRTVFLHSTAQSTL